MTINKTHIYGLIGLPLTHSFSQDFFNKKFLAENIDAEYLNFEIPSIENIKDVIESNPNLRGLNVTIPYKEQVIEYLDDIDDDAREIGAVNVIKFYTDKKGEQKMKGYNSDVIGFLDSIRPCLNPLRSRALILGTGGAAKAVAHALKIAGVKIQFVSRTKRDNTITYDELTREVIENHLIIVNTTPLGMYPHNDTCPNIPYEYITSDHLCYDLLYNPDETLFMKKSKEHGAEVKNGLEMLLLQAFVAWHIWTDKV